ncbi:MAG: response regulator transcription factor [Treponema sp.]|nr:response regulator transcription factor [Treponema sp.]
MQAGKKSFYIIDDHEMLRLGTASYIQNNSDWSCAGSAGNGQDALSDIKALADRGEPPLLVICDLNFYGQDSGFELVKVLRSLYPQTKIVVYSMFFAPGIVQSAVECGASGYVSKNASSDELILCMEKTLAGQVYVQEELRQKLENFNSFTDALTQREKTVMALLLRRFTNDQIAAELDIKKRAVENYISSIYDKTGVNDKAELVKRFG